MKEEKAEGGRGEGEKEKEEEAEEERKKLKKSKKEKIQRVRDEVTRLHRYLRITGYNLIVFSITVQIQGLVNRRVQN